MSAKQNALEYQGRECVSVHLKWFNAAKGFGFVVPDDEVLDAFLHITQLQKMGLTLLGEGARLVCNLEYSAKGAIVTEILEITDPGSVPEIVCDPDPEYDGCFQIRGLVKNYTPSRGFGFVIPEDGMKDIFVHKTCLTNSGIACLYAGQQVRVTFRAAQKGREAVRIVIESDL